MRGILYIALGTEYDRLAAHTAAKTRQHTTLPIAVVSNQTIHHPHWDTVTDVRFVPVDVPSEWNRVAKTLACNYTPFDETLLLDADAFVQQPGVDTLFDTRGEADFAFYPWRAWHTNMCIPAIMARALDMFGLDVPIQEYHSGCFCFAANERVQTLFQLWHAAWRKFGCGRDMPPLACVMKHELPRHTATLAALTQQQFIPNRLDPTAIVQHDPGTGFPPEYGIPTWTPWHVPTDHPGEFKRIRRVKP